MDNSLLQKNQIDFLSNILEPDTAFSDKSIVGRKIYYISDIHLLHHVCINNWKEQVKYIVKSLYTEELIKDILEFKQLYIVFCGDVCSSSEIAKYFFHLFKIRCLFYLYKRWSNQHEKILPISKKTSFTLV